MQRNEYKEIFAISQSAIKAFKNKPLQKFKQIYIDQEEDDEDNSKFALGSLVDTLALQPDLLDDRFYICESDISIPGEKVKAIIDKVYKEAVLIIDNKIKLNKQGNLPELLYIPNITDLSEWNDLIIKFAREIKFGGTTWSTSRILDTVHGDGVDYFRMLGLCNNRYIITPYDNAEAIEMVESLRKDIYSKPYFIQQENETLLFQQEIFINFKENSSIRIPIKAALDIIRFNHIEKTVQVADLKTTYSNKEENFKFTAKSFDYLIQGSFYNFVLKNFILTYEEGKYSNYTILSPINIVIDKEYKVPYIYEYDSEDINIAESGSEELNYKGWKHYLNEIIWHITTGIWDKPKEIHDFGKIKLKIFKNDKQQG
jgi:hypothetical protein